MNLECEKVSVGAGQGGGRGEGEGEREDVLPSDGSEYFETRVDVVTDSQVHQPVKPVRHVYYHSSPNSPSHHTPLTVLTCQVSAELSPGGRVC